MEIGPIRPEQLRPKATDETGQQQPTKFLSVKEDSVEISSRARAKLADAASIVQASDFVLSEIDESDKLDIIKLKVKTGFYDRPEIKQQIAEKLIGNK